MKKLVKELIIGSIIIIITLFGIYYVFFKTKDEKQLATYEVVSSEDYIINGKIIPREIQKINNELIYGDKHEFLVKNGQEVKVGEDIIKYTNSEINDELTYLKRQIDQVSNRINDNKNKNKNSYTEIKNIEIDISKFNLEKEELISLEPIENLEPTNNNISLQESKLLDLSEKISKLELEKDNLLIQISTNEDSIKEQNIQIEDLRTQIDMKNKKKETIIKSKINGYITIIDDSESEETNLIAEINSRNISIDSEIAEYYKSKIKEGDLVEVRIISTEQKLEGNVHKISNKPLEDIAQNGGMSKYEIIINTDEIVDLGYSVEVVFKSDEILVPKEFVEDDKVILKEDDEYKEVALIIEEYNDTHYRVVSGLKNGDILIKDKNMIPKVKGIK